MSLFADSLLARKAGNQVPDNGYGGAYIEDWAQKMPEELSLEEALNWGSEHAKEDQRQTLEMIGIVFDTWFSERSMMDSGAIDRTIEDLEEKEAIKFLIRFYT